MTASGYDAVRHFDPAMGADEFLDQAVFRAKQGALARRQPGPRVHVPARPAPTAACDFLQELHPQGHQRRQPGAIWAATATRLTSTCSSAIREGKLVGERPRQRLAEHQERQHRRATTKASRTTAVRASRSLAKPRRRPRATSNNVAHAYLLMRPGDVDRLLSTPKQFGDPLGPFPEGGRGDALGGMSTATQVTTLVNLRNTHGRGNYMDRTPARRREGTALLRARELGAGAAEQPRRQRVRPENHPDRLRARHSAWSS